jgi:hypothetical protein
MEPFHGEITVQEDQNVLFKKKIFLQNVKLLIIAML